MAIYLTVLLAILNQTALKGSKMLVALYAIELGASPLAIGMLISMYAVFPVVLAVYAGRISDRAGEALGLRLTVNKFTEILVPIAFGSLGTAAGVFPVFWANALLLLIGGYLSAEKRK